MRLLLKLKSTKDQPYQEHHYQLQGFIYNLLKGSKFENIHDKEGYKFFCFSNIFPASDLKVRDIRHLIISSPNGHFIKHIADRLEELMNSKRYITIGNMEFDIKMVKPFDIKLKMPVTLITGTPIVIRIPRAKYERFNIKPKYPYKYLYWRQEYPLELFIEQFEDNLRKKYRAFSGRDANNESIIEMLRFKKQVSTKIIMKDQEHTVIGTVWEFWFNDYTHKELLRFGIDSGFGERNSLGFGFMNVIKNE
jgi:CRISPR-associated endoribonuclease Cas6